MSKDVVQVVKSFKAPKAAGKHFRLLCMTGEDKGISYFLKSNRAIVGRGSTADIKIKDAKSSREHAELTKVKNTYVVTDLGSQNGIMVNDLKINQHTLNDGDTIIIGKTVLKFNIIDVEEFKIDANASSKKGEDDEEDDDDETPKKSKKKLIIIGVLILVVVMMMGEEEQGSNKSSNKSKKFKDASSNYLDALREKKKVADKENQVKLDAIIHRGQREFREKNYFRAIEEFNLALVLDPGNGRAGFYLNKTTQYLDNEIEEMFLKARREYDSLKFRTSSRTYCSIMKMLQRYTDDARYIRAEVQVRNIEDRLGMFEGEINCI
ncbi:MAG: FHA domain-containing protein [Bdellovibrionales bacterium]|jgi:pSer/pThr/pTyr-binding forkhead associated (FHA) protein|nr:FHA domain-containing protein [Bdellovibrionales bacterium]